jgi:hypothetical protein
MIRLNMKIIQNERVNIMTDRELLELIATKVANLTNQMDKLTVDVSEVKDETKKTNTKIDHEIIPKITTLFDGHKQNSDKLDRIEEEVFKY